MLLFIAFVDTFSITESMKRRQGDIFSFFNKKKIGRENAGDQQEYECQSECSLAASTEQNIQGPTSIVGSPGEKAGIREKL